MHESGCEGVVCDGHAEEGGHGCGAQQGEETGGEEEGGYAVVCEEFEGGLLVYHGVGFLRWVSSFDGLKFESEGKLPWIVPVLFFFDLERFAYNTNGVFI